MISRDDPTGRQRAEQAAAAKRRGGLAAFNVLRFDVCFLDFMVLSRLLPLAGRAYRSAYGPDAPLSRS